MIKTAIQHAQTINPSAYMPLSYLGHTAFAPRRHGNWSFLLKQLLFPLHFSLSLSFYPLPLHLSFFSAFLLYYLHNYPHPPPSLCHLSLSRCFPLHCPGCFNTPPLASQQLYLRLAFGWRLSKSSLFQLPSFICASEIPTCFVLPSVSYPLDLRPWESFTLLFILPFTDLDVALLHGLQVIPTRQLLSPKIRVLRDDRHGYQRRWAASKTTDGESLVYFLYSTDWHAKQITDARLDLGRRIWVPPGVNTSQPTIGNGFWMLVLTS